MGKEEPLGIHRKQLNEIYRKLDQKAHELVAPFVRIQRNFDYSFGFYNGHYSKNENGKYEKDYFPIPEITIKGLCDIEIHLDWITVSTKLARDTVFSYDFEKLKSYRFEAFGVKNYLDDFYVEGNTIEDLIRNVEKSGEKEIGFAFYFTHELRGVTLYEFVKFLRKEGFFC